MVHLDRHMKWLTWSERRSHSVKWNYL